MSIEQDTIYINKTLKGDVNSFAFLVNKYQNFVYTLVFRMLKNKHDAEEITQDVFIKAFKVLDTFRKDSKFSSWLYSIAYRKALDLIRKNKRMVLAEDISNIGLDKFSSVKSALEVLETEERKEIIKNCIDQLPYETSSLFLLFYFEEMSIEEVAKITDLTKENVKVKLYRGRKKLYSILQKQLVNDLIASNGY